MVAHGGVGDVEEPAEARLVDGVPVVELVRRAALVDVAEIGEHVRFGRLDHVRHPVDSGEPSTPSPTTAIRTRSPGSCSPPSRRREGLAVWRWGWWLSMTRGRQGRREARREHHPAAQDPRVSGNRVVPSSIAYGASDRPSSRSGGTCRWRPPVVDPVDDGCPWRVTAPSPRRSRPGSMPSGACRQIVMVTVAVGPLWSRTPLRPPERLRPPVGASRPASTTPRSPSRPTCVVPPRAWPGCA